jgi:hypothetical protein
MYLKKDNVPGTSEGTGKGMEPSYLYGSTNLHKYILKVEGVLCNS